MRNEALARVADVLVGEWKLTMTDAWFWDDPSAAVVGSATIEWFHDAFLTMRWDFEGEQPAWWVLSRNDARAEFVALSYDERGVLRVFNMSFNGAGGEWLMSREDPDFHQRFVGTVASDGNRIDAHPDASEDEGRTWRKDFDLIFERRT